MDQGVKLQIIENDPNSLPDRSIDFSKSLYGINVSAVAQLFNGKIAGLRTLHGIEPLSVKEEKGRVHVIASLGVGVLSLHWECTIKFMNLGPELMLQCVYHGVEDSIEFSYDAETGKNGVLHKYKIEQLKNVRHWFFGLGPLNWIFNLVLNISSPVFIKIVKKVLEYVIKQHIGEKIKDFEFPVKEWEQLMKPASEKVI